MKNVLISGAALLALPHLLALPARAQGPVSGMVAAANSDSPPPPLAGVTVLLDGQAVGVTDTTGRFEIPAVGAGPHRLRLSHVGYASLERAINGAARAQSLQFALHSNPLLTETVTITASRANERTATAYTNLSKQDLAKRNFGQDLPYLLDQTPSVVVNSDAGAGIGYTGIRVRGTDIAGINVTINGVPLNNAESHGAFFVNLPDLASSSNSIQVQRGVGTSQNGGAAFGASIHIGTLDFRRAAYGETQHTYGSYHTWKNNVSFGTGLLADRFTIDGRLSRLSTDGYIDRAAADLQSYYLAAGYQHQYTSLKFVVFSGREQTYQAWNGVPEDSLATNRRHNEFTYDNQIDHYQQHHYQLHFSQGLGANWSLGTALHLTRGLGYYEEYKPSERLAGYGIAPLALGDTTIDTSDLVRRKWLDNYFYGATYALSYEPTAAAGRLSATLGGGWNRYDGDHYGEVIWARYAARSAIRQRYYFNQARKTDFNVFLKATYQVLPRLGLFGDVQLRTINYRLAGREDNAQDLTTRTAYTFFNPKAGLTYTLSETQSAYASFAVGQREPIRADFVDRPAADQARPERLHDFEAGYRFRSQAETGPALRAEANYFYMDYRNQLVATGQLNDVGTALRTNIARSYRTGVELSGAAGMLAERLTLSSTLTLSRNQLRNFREVVYVYDEEYAVAGTQQNEPRSSTISYSPAVVSGSTVEGEPLKGLRVAMLYKTVSEQFLDNSASDARRLKPYQVADLRLRYTIRPAWVQEIELGLLINNLFNREYVANGYTFGGIYQPGTERLSFNYYYPQATRNFLASVGVKL